jgi:V-type H+-transporting ATPase subunit C
VNFQAILIHPNKKNQKRLRDVLNQLYGHLDGSASSSSVNADVNRPQHPTHSLTKLNVDMVETKI